ncbi:MAG: hypothetical protein WD073_03160 [Xanthobacteraceae bacterium]
MSPIEPEGDFISVLERGVLLLLQQEAAADDPRLDVDAHKAAISSAFSISD